MACAVIQARTCPACQAVTRALNLVGLGNLPAFTMRHSVGAENGRGAMALSGLLGLRTSCDSRSQALSGRRSNTAWSGAVCAAGIVAGGMLVTVVVGLLLRLILRVMIPSFMSGNGGDFAFAELDCHRNCGIQCRTCGVRGTANYA